MYWTHDINNFSHFYNLHNMHTPFIICIDFTAYLGERFNIVSSGLHRLHCIYMCSYTKYVQLNIFAMYTR